MERSREAGAGLPVPPSVTLAVGLGREAGAAGSPRPVAAAALPAAAFFSIAGKKPEPEPLIRPTSAERPSLIDPIDLRRVAS